MIAAPLFIVFEGTDGSGTSTQGDRLAATLRERGHVVVRTAEPSDGAVGQLLRSILRGESAHPADPETVALLFAADRVDHCARLIGPALARGEFVVCDRYLGSSLAFQVVDGGGRIDADWVLAINRAARVPHLSVLLDVPIETAVERIRARGKPLERFEIAETLAQVQGRYRQVFGRPPPGLGRQTLVLRADRSREALAAAVLTAVDDLTVPPEPDHHEGRA